MAKPTDFNLEKTVQALNFFLNLERSKTASKMKLIKLLWLADRFTLRNYGYSITHDDYYAMQHGPVGTVTLDILNKDKISAYIDNYIDILSVKDIASKAAPDYDEFSETDISTLRMVYAVYGHMSAGQLRDFTHKFPEWKRFEEKIDTIGGSYRMEIDDFFTNPDSRVVKNIFTEDENVLELNKQFYQEEKKLQAVFG